MTIFNKFIFILFIASFPMLSHAAIWTIVPAESTLSFIATQNGAPATGTFKKFTGDIDFDPAQLASSHVKITVDMASVSDSYNQLSDTLQTTDWFNTKMFPQAIFQTTGFTKTVDKTYQAKGNLAIRDKTQNIILTFTLEEYTPTQAKITGSTTIKRTAFGIGQGEWSDTNTVKDDVQVNFTITADKK